MSGPVSKRNGRTPRGMFALPAPPPDLVEAAGREYELRQVFKHDFFAATCLYESADGERIVVKFPRERDFLGLPVDALTRALTRHEERICRMLAGIEGVPRYVGRVGEHAWALEYLDALPLDHLDAPPAGFFDALRDLFDAVHARGVAYGDANKRSNILVSSDGRPCLVDFQIALRRRDDLPGPLRWIARRLVEYIVRKDVYHLYKHKRRMAPGELRPEEEALSRHRSGLHLLHRRLTKPYRAVRRALLGWLHRRGKLTSPSERWEDHHQPEKATWRGKT